MSEKNPTWTRTRVGRNRVHWVAYDARPETEDRQIVDQGYAASLPEADVAARAALAAAGMYQARRLSTGFASASRDRPKPEPQPRPERARKAEYVYTRHAGEPGEAPLIAAHLIVKKTAKKVYVTLRSCGLNQLGTEDERWEPADKTIPLDRLGLERDGSVYSKNHRHSDFFAKPDAAIGDSPRPDSDAFKTLAIRPPCSLDEIKAAYRRRAMEVHPDRGGTTEEFQSVEAAYRRLVREAQVSEA